MRVTRTLAVGVTTAGLLLGSMGIAKADTLYNTLDNTIDNGNESTSVKVGATEVVTLKLTAKNFSGNTLDGDTQCLISSSNPAWIDLVSGSASIATVKAKNPLGGIHPDNRLVFTSCSDVVGQDIVVTGVSVGSADINASVNQGAGRALSSQVQTNTAKFTVNVAKGDQTITFAQPDSPAVNGSSFYVNPTSSSGLPVSLAAAGSCSRIAATAPATGFDVTMTADSGDCTLTASQAGNANWNAASNVVRTVAAAPVVNPNVAPTQPGKPETASPNAGAFTLSWTASTDADNDAITYTLEHKRSDALEYNLVAGGLTASSHTFTSAEREGEGTFTYRVRANDGTVDSVDSDESDPVKVDRSVPNAPTAAATTDPDYTDTNGSDWWKGSVTVGFTANGDPNLADGTTGSGVDASTLSAAQTFNTTGSHSSTSTVKDNVGNTSQAGTLTVRVDATIPTASVSTTAGCPSGNLVQGSTASFGWTASDVGSGLATAATGTTSINTSAIGTNLTATGPAPRDNVGGVGTAPSCTYNVVYSSTGILQPINSDGSSKFKLGSTIPVKVRLTGASAGTSNAIITFVISKVTNTVSGEELEAVSTATPHSGNTLRYDDGGDQYIFNLSTKNLSTGTWRITLNMGDGTTRTETFSIVR